VSTTSTIGTSSRNYSTITAWLAAFASGGWIGECYNDSEFVETLSFSGHATSASDYITLRPATGQSAFDTANPLLYDQSKGVGISSNAIYALLVYVNESYVTLQRLQLRTQNAAFGGSRVISLNFGLVGVVIDRVLAQNESSVGSGSDGVMFLSQGVKATNCVAIGFNCAGIQIYYGNSDTVVVNNTIVAPSDKSNTHTGIIKSSGTGTAPTIKNNAVFGYATSIDTGFTQADHNASDQSLPGTNNQASLTYSSQFTGITSAAMDFRLKAGSALIGTAVTDTTDIPAAIDIFGTVRP
jgi:hypothetical protein